MITRYRASYLTVLLLALVLGGAAQDKDRSKDPKEKAPFDVTANLLVMDANRSHVNDIKIEDLKLLEDGVEQKITTLSKRDPIAHIALVIDNTGSMRTQLATVLTAAATLTNGLDPENEFLVIRFVDSATIEIVEEWTSDKAKLLDAMKHRLYVQGGQSAVIDALYLAGEAVKERRKDLSHRYAIVAISDFEDRVSFYDRPALLRLLNSADIDFFAVGIMPDLPDRKRPKAEFLANTTALSTGGRAFVMKKEVTAEMLLASLRAIALELNSQYVIGYTPTNQERNTERKVTIEVRDGSDGSKRLGIIREGYTVPKNY